jgi:hypothetical protein
MVTNWKLGAALALGVAVTGMGGCKGKSSGGGQATTGGGGAMGNDKPSVGVPARGVGMDDPFARMTGDQAKALNAGYKALKAKKYDDARDAFTQVSQGLPDYTAARFQQVRAAALGGHFDDVPALWADLVARDFVAYAGRLEKPKDMAPLRASPAWAQVQAAEAAVKAAYAMGLDKGFFFIGRTRDAGAPKFGSDGSAKLDLKQEVYHYDPSTQRYRRLTDAGGDVFAINVSADHKALVFLVTPKLQDKGGGASVFAGPQGGTVELASLATTGPFPLGVDGGKVDLWFSSAGEPVWSADNVAYTFDTAKTAMVSLPGGKDDGKSGITHASPQSVVHEDPQAGGAKLAADGMSVEIEGGKPLRSARALDANSLGWSPGKKRLVYAGKLDACKLIKEGKAGKGDKNELYLWDTEKKTATRIGAPAVSSFDTLWLDDDHLVYEGGVGKDGKLHVYDVGSRADTVLKAHYGAGLFGFPSLACEEAPAAAEEQPEAPTEEPQGE